MNTKKTDPGDSLACKFRLFLMSILTVMAFGSNVFACERQEIQKKSENNAQRIGKKIKENIKIQPVGGWELRTKYSSYKIPQKHISISLLSDSGGIWKVFLKNGDSIVYDAKRRLMPMWLGYQTNYSIEQFDYVTGIRRKGKKIWEPFQTEKLSERSRSTACDTQDEIGITAPMEVFFANPKKAERVILPFVQLNQKDDRTRTVYNNYLGLNVRAENVESNIDSLTIIMESDFKIVFGIGKGLLCKHIFGRDSLCFHHTGI